MAESDNQNMIKFQPGDLVIQEKTKSGSLYVVKEGQLQAYKTDKQGNTIPLGLIRSGEYIGEASILLDTPHTSNVKALTPVTLIKIPSKVIEKQLEQVPKWVISLTKNLVSRVIHTNEIIRRHNIVDEKLLTSIEALEKQYAPKSDGK